MSIKKWTMIIAVCGLVVGLVGAQDATSEATAAATAEATSAATSEVSVEATAAATSEAPVEATAEAPAATEEAVTGSTEAKTPQEWCDTATITEPTTREFAGGAERVLEPGVNYQAIFCTGAGAVYVDLFEDIAPKTVNNFVFLSEQGYYNNSNFHRVLADFMVQGGDPVGNPPGTGGPGYSFEDEFAGHITFDRPGLLAMANTGQPSSNGSQFFITTSLPSHLNYRHTIFGEVLEGYENVLAIDLRDPETATEPGEALNTVLIITDPSTVTTTYEVPASELATSDAVAQALGSVITVSPLPEGLVAGEPQGVVAIADVIANLPEDVQDAATTYYESHNHQYRVTQSVVNEQCNTQYVFTSLTYTIDAYATAEDATAALNDAVLNDINTAEGFTPEDSFSKVYTRPVTDCAGAEGKEGRVYLQRGRYVAIAEGIFPISFLGEAPLEAVLSQTAITFEVPLVDIYRNER